jgi:SAM-dependent methyltransferase
MNPQSSEKKQSENTITELQDRELFDRIAANYARKDTVGSTSHARQYQLICAVAPVLKEQGKVRLLFEMACGVGASAKYLRGRYDRYIGIDYSEKLIEAARIFNKDNPQAEFITANIKDADIGSDKADIILAVGALHHMIDIPKVMTSLKKIAKPGAFFVAIEPQRGNPAVQFLRRTRTKIDKSYSEKQLYFSRQELINMMADNGMTDIETEYQGYFSPPFAQVILKPQFVFIPMSGAAVLIDKAFDKILPGFLRIFSWNIMLRCRFPEK